MYTAYQRQVLCRNSHNMLLGTSSSSTAKGKYESNQIRIFIYEDQTDIPIHKSFVPLDCKLPSSFFCTRRCFSFVQCQFYRESKRTKLNNTWTTLFFHKQLFVCASVLRKQRIKKLLQNNAILPIFGKKYKKKSTSQL